MHWPKRFEHSLKSPRSLGKNGDNSDNPLELGVPLSAPCSDEPASEGYFENHSSLGQSLRSSINFTVEGVLYLRYLILSDQIGLCHFRFGV